MKRGKGRRWGPWEFWGTAYRRPDDKNPVTVEFRARPPMKIGRFEWCDTEYRVRPQQRRARKGKA